MNPKFLIIQTAFAGDVILATAFVEKLKEKFPDSTIDFLVRAGNESLLENNPHLREVLVWHKKKEKTANLFRMLVRIRKEKYSIVIDLHRFGSSGFLTVFSGAKERIGFDKNPWSIFFTKRVKHEIGNGKHETQRNQELLPGISDRSSASPRLYPNEAVFRSVKRFKQQPYICIFPCSVWFTKTFPESKWLEFLAAFKIQKPDVKVYLLGSSAERVACDRIRSSAAGMDIQVLAGDLSFLESAALMKDASMNYVNDSAPLHMASAMNANVTAIFCSTIPAFGFGPLSRNSKIVETKETLACRPCGLHGFNSCPQKHFKCALTIDIDQLL